MLVLSMKNVSKVYKMGDEKITALKNVSLDLKKGKIYCLIGSSGSGKSTLLNLMAGLEKPSKGEIIFKSAHIEKLNENQLTEYRKKYVGFVFQSFNLLSSLTALENVTLPLIFKKIDVNVRIKKARELLKKVGLADREKNKPTQLSGGQQQRVSIARAFIHDPEIIFADEPTGNLDTKTTIEMIELILNMIRQNNQTLVIVTHDMEISDYADVVINIRDGAITEIKQNNSPII